MVKDVNDDFSFDRFQFNRADSLLLAESKEIADFSAPAAPPKAIEDKIVSSAHRDSTTAALNNPEYDFVNDIPAAKLEELVWDANEEFRPSLEGKSELQDFFQPEEYEAVLKFIEAGSKGNDTINLTQQVIRTFASLNPELAQKIERVDSKDIGATQEDLVQNIRNAFKYLLAANELDTENNNPNSFFKRALAELPSMSAMHSRLIEYYLEES